MTGTGIDCVYVDSRAAVPAGVAEIVGGSAGSFDNIICGTGWMADDNPTFTSVVTTPNSPATENRFLATDFGYHVVLTGGQGTLTWGDNATPGNPDPNTSLSGVPVGGGYIELTPWRGPLHPLGDQGGTFPGTFPNGQCTNGFNVEGVVAGTIEGDPSGSTNPPSGESPPVVVGAPIEGQTLTTTNGTWQGTEPFNYTYDWQRCDANGANCVSTGETDSQYTLTRADVGKTMRVEVTASNNYGSDSQTSAPTPVILVAAPDNPLDDPPSPGSPPTVVGVPIQGLALAATPGTWGGGPPTNYSYRWKRCDAAGGACTDTGASSPAYPLGSADVGKTMRAEVTASNGAGSATQTSAPSGVVQPLSVDLDGDDPGPPLGEASAVCKSQGGTPLPPQHALGTVDFWTYVSTPPGKVNLCVRAEAGTQVAGGRLEVDITGSPGVAPVVDTTQTDMSPAACPQEIHEGEGTDRNYTSPIGSNPVKVCITILGTNRRIDVGTTGTAAPPHVRWVPDTGSPGPPVEVP